MWHVWRQIRGAYKVLVGRTEAKKPLGRTSGRWDYNIKLHLRQVGWRGMEWTDMADDSESWWSFANTVMNVRAPENKGNFYD